MRDCITLITEQILTMTHYPGIEADINRVLKNLRIFHLVENTKFDEHHPFYLLIRGLVPMNLFDMLRSFTKAYKSALDLMFMVLNLVSTKVTNPIWSQYTAALIKWEKTNFIHSHLKHKKRSRKSRFIKKNKKTKTSNATAVTPSTGTHNSIPQVSSLVNPDNAFYNNRGLDPTESNSAFVHDNATRLPPNFWVYFTSSYFRHGGNIYTHFTQDAASYIMTI
jgi:hypothetical protein